MALQAAQKQMLNLLYHQIIECDQIQDKTNIDICYQKYQESKNQNISNRKMRRWIKKFKSQKKIYGKLKLLKLNLHKTIMKIDSYPNGHENLKQLYIKKNLLNYDMCTAILQQVFTSKIKPEQIPMMPPPNEYENSVILS